MPPCGKLRGAGRASMLGMGPLALALLALAALPVRSRADDEKIEIRVVAVLATSQNAVVDPRLKTLAPEVQKNHPNLTGFEVYSQSKKAMNIGDTASFALIDKTEVTVTLKERDKSGCVTIRVNPPTLGEITYSCCCGKFMPFITGHETKEKKVLVVAVMVQPCKKKDPKPEKNKPKPCGCANDRP